jgi:hypothetical protein
MHRCQLMLWQRIELNRDIADAIVDLQFQFQCEKPHDLLFVEQQNAVKLKGPCPL